MTNPLLRFYTDIQRSSMERRDALFAIGARLPSMAFIEELDRTAVAMLHWFTTEPTRGTTDWYATGYDREAGQFCGVTVSADGAVMRRWWPSELESDDVQPDPIWQPRTVAYLMMTNGGQQS